MGAKKVKSLESQFPENIFVTWGEPDGHENRFLLAHETDTEAVEDSEEPTVIAVYKLESVYRAKKSVEYLD